jgi:hypothetical protein
LEAPPPLQTTRKGVEWVKKNSKWSCKVVKCKESSHYKVDINYTLKKVHELIVKK